MNCTSATLFRKKELCGRGVCGDPGLAVLDSQSLERELPLLYHGLEFTARPRPECKMTLWGRRKPFGGSSVVPPMPRFA